MRIAINATIASKTRTGTGHYAANLASALMQADHDHELLIYCDATLLDWFADRRNGHHIAFKPVKFQSSTERIWWEQTKLGRELRKEKPGLLHSLAFTSPVLTDCRSVVTVHDLIFLNYPKTLPMIKRCYYRPIFSTSIRRAWRLICLSETVKREIVENLHIDEERVFCVPTTVGTEFLGTLPASVKNATLRKLGIEWPYILSGATFDPRKNIPTLIRAYQELKKDSGIPHKLVLIGRTGWSRSGEVLRGLIPSASRDVVFTGYVSQEELPFLYSGASLFAFPSFYEGFGLPPLEACATNVPVVVSDIPVHREIYGDAAILVEPNDIAGWQRAMLKILRDEQLRQQLIMKGNRLLEKYNWDKTVQKTLEVYRMDDMNASS